MKTYTLEEVCRQLAISEESVVTFVEREWITLIDDTSKTFDDEDRTRLQLIIELQKNFNVNDEGIDIIMHLLDQLHSLKRLTLMGNQQDEES